MTRLLTLLPLLLLSACVGEQNCDCVEVVPDAEIEAQLGIPADAILLSGSQRQDDGHWQEYMQLDMAKVTDAALQALPAKLCASDEAGVAGWHLAEPTADHITFPGSKVLIVKCTLKEQPA